MNSSVSFFAGKHEVVDSYPLMFSPFPIFTIFIVYLYFVLKIGPEFMKNRKPFELTTLIRCYNVFQILACIYYLVTAFQLGYSHRFAWKCLKGKVFGTEAEAYKLSWYFLMLRLLELVETVFFVLRKKQNQVSSLHVYHHISSAFLYWAFLKYSADVMEALIPVINSFVHLVMYCYYFASSFKDYTKWTRKVKPALTIIQLVQLVIILGHCFVAIQPSCNATSWFYVQLINISILIYMFSKFYNESYVKKKN